MQQRACPTESNPAHCIGLWACGFRQEATYALAEGYRELKMRVEQQDKHITWMQEVSTNQLMQIRQLRKDRG